MTYEAGYQDGYQDAIRDANKKTAQGAKPTVASLIQALQQTPDDALAGSTAHTEWFSSFDRLRIYQDIEDLDGNPVTVVDFDLEEATMLEMVIGDPDVTIPLT